MTIDQIKTAADTNIRAKTADNSVTRDEVADLFDNLADEQRDRGLFGVDTTAGLAAVSGANYRKVSVADTGIFEWASTGTANGTTIFAASGGGVWILKMAIPKGALAALNSIDYTSGYLTNKPTLGALAAVNSIDYASGALTNKPDLSLKADLVGGKVPSAQLPSYVDDVEEYANLAAFPGTGETGKIYITLDNNSTYRWSGSQYVLLVSGGGGGSQSLDSVLGVGNVTDLGIVFENGSGVQPIFLIDSTYLEGHNNSIEIFKVINPDHSISNAVGDFRFTAWHGATSGVTGISNFVSMWGYNNNAGGGLSNNNDASIHISMEGRWDQGGGTNWKELHIPQVNYHKADGSGIERSLRAATYIFDVNPAARAASLAYTLTSFGIGILPVGFNNSTANSSTFSLTESQLKFESTAANPYISLGKAGNTPFTIQMVGGSGNDVNITSQGTLSLVATSLNLSGFIDNPSGSMRVTAPSGTTWGLEINSASATHGPLYVRNGSAVAIFVTPSANTIFGDGGYYDNTSKITVDGAITAKEIKIESTTKGFLPPRMTKTQRNAISSPGPGLIVIVIGETGGEYQSIYNANQTRWEKVSTTVD